MAPHAGGGQFLQASPAKDCYRRSQGTIREALGAFAASKLFDHDKLGQVLYLQVHCHCSGVGNPPPQSTHLSLTFFALYPVQYPPKQPSVQSLFFKYHAPSSHGMRNGEEVVDAVVDATVVATVEVAGNRVVSCVMEPTQVVNG